LFFVIFSLVCDHALAKKNRKKTKKRAKKLNNPNCLAIAKLIKSLGSKKSIKQISKKLGKKCAKFKFLFRIKNELNNLRKKAAVLRKRNKKISKRLWRNVIKEFFDKIFRVLLKFKAVRNSKAGKRIKKALKKFKKRKKE